MRQMGVGIKVHNPDKEYCFVMMPFQEQDHSLYRVVCEAARNVGLIPIRSDEILEPGDILDKIYEVMGRSRVCVAEISDRNPNVMYELGWSLWFGKRPQVVIMVRADQGEVIEVPFDVTHARQLRYSTAAEGTWGIEPTTST